ncbi:hypothetical protein ACHQM5_006494 [Ranunculus cassubicifolius]
MASILLVCLILVNFLLVHSMAARYVQKVMEPNVGNSLTLAPAHSQGLLLLQGLRNRHFRLLSFTALSPSSPKQQHAEAPASLDFAKKLHVTQENAGLNITDSPGITHTRKHHANDKSIYGGAIILGGLAVTFLVSVVCYIRVTRRREGEIKV